VIRNSVIRNNFAGLGGGGGIFLHYAKVTIKNSTIHYNLATKGKGGGMRTVHGSLKIKDSLIQYNAARERGGGIDSQRTILDLINSRIINNVAPQYPNIYQKQNQN